MMRFVPASRKRGMIAVVAAVAFLSGVVSVCGRPVASGSRGTECRLAESLLATRQTWVEVSMNASSPADICKAARSRISYARDIQKEDEWRAGRDTWGRRQGDCEDFAVVVKDLCDERGFKADVYVVQSRPAMASHAVTIGEHNGVMWMSGNGEYEEIKSLADAMESLARAFGWWVPDMEIFKVENARLADERRFVRVDGGN